MDPTQDYSGQIIDKYHLVEKLGSGSFGTVYKAYNVVLKTNTALKILCAANAHEVLKLFEEAAIPHKCQHPNIIRINTGLVASFEGSLCFLVDMQLVDNGSVEALLKKRFIPVIESIEILKKALFGISHAHLHDVIHRDIKPANILMNGSNPLVSDFGLAAAVNAFITPPVWYYTHRAPETLGSSIATVQSDIFAIGMTFYRMINNIVDWYGFLSTIPGDIDNLIQTGKLIERLPFQPYIPRQCKTIFKKACHLDLNKRYKTADELRDSLERLQLNCSWLQESPYTWVGTDYQTGQKREAQYRQIAKRHEIEVKTKGRRSRKECGAFDSANEALAYMTSYIANSTLK